MFSDLLGTKFTDGGRSKETGFDCWGLVIEIYRRHGIVLPEYTMAAYDDVSIAGVFTSEIETGAFVRVPDGLPAPAIVLMRLMCGQWANHVGVHVGNGRFIHICKGAGVAIERLDSLKWKSRIEGIYTLR